MQLSALYIHPIKSVAALACERMHIEACGPVDDRRWMLVDSEGRFVSGRELGAMVRLRAQPAEGGIELHWNGESLHVATPRADAPRLQVKVWKDSVDAALAASAAHSWLSARLQRELRLVHMDARSERHADPQFAPADSPVSFADGFPMLLIGQSSLDQLNQRCSIPIQMTRFRPNLVVSGAAPHAEDQWQRIRIGSVEFDVVKPCTRCVFTTVDPESGERDQEGEPLKTLKTYRRSELGITFGVNLVARNQGELSRGLAVEILR